MYILASKVSKRSSANIKGILEITGDKIIVHVEDISEAFVLADFIREFDGKEVRISIAHSEEEA